MKEFMTILGKLNHFFFVKIKLNNACQCIDVRSECSFQTFLSAYHRKMSGKFGLLLEKCHGILFCSVCMNAVYSTVGIGLPG